MPVVQARPPSRSRTSTIRQSKRASASRRPAANDRHFGIADGHTPFRDGRIQKPAPILTMRGVSPDLLDLAPLEIEISPPAASKGAALSSPILPREQKSAVFKRGLSQHPSPLIQGGKTWPSKPINIPTQRPPDISVGDDF
jgi:hypothetical protein